MKKISFKIGLLAILSALIPLIVSGVVMYVKMTRLAINDQIDQAKEVVFNGRQQILSEFEKSKIIVNLMAEVVEKWGPEDGFRLFSSLVTPGSDYLFAYMGMEKDGSLAIAPKADLPDGYDARKRSWYTTASAVEPKVSEPYADMATGISCVTVCREVYRDGKKLGVVALDVNLAAFSEKIAKLRIGETGAVFLIHNNESILAHADKALVGRKISSQQPELKKALHLKNGLFDYTDNDGERFLFVESLTEDGWTIGGGTLYSEIIEPVIELEVLIFIVSVAVLILVLLVTFFISRSISRPIIACVEFAEAMAKGDLRSRMNSGVRDETGILAAALNRMSENLGNMVGDIVQATRTLSGASSALSTISSGLAENAEQTTEKAVLVASAAEQMNANMSSVSAASEETAVNVNMVAAAAEEMTATISEIAGNSDKTKRITEKAVTRSERASRQIDELGQAALQIGKVTETITEISEQTNLLALNATIEAARAGEAGKGFAVVANEIKDLARQTSEATGEIREKIEGIQAASSSSVKDIKEVASIIKEANEMVSEVSHAVDEQANTTQEIAGNVTQASQGIGEVNEHVSQVSTVADKVAADITEVGKAARKMNDSSKSINDSSNDLEVLAGRLTELVGRFKL
ncbi:MAG: hypothetical protein CSA26_08425 [Desulfobacterales bacterium]|nr:MAG: hypothetical protein CSB22_00045 [Deltaproteobacteria bacterium]PIE64373.1 MAG: hypothetical protein CSA26_08425 [Desulfobacterales bacterium]